jgi:hypothetical protein
MNDAEIRYVTRQLQWALEENKATMSKAHELTAGLNFDDAETALWHEIIKHIADGQSHLKNALSKMPELPEPVRDEQPLQSEREALAQSAYYSPVFWQGQKFWEDQRETAKQERTDTERAEAFVQWLRQEVGS